MQKFWEQAAAVRAERAPGGLLPGELVLRHGGRAVRIAPASVLAPMSGITDTVFRRYIRDLGGCGLIMTEFTSGDGIVRSEKVARRYLSFAEEERPIAAQLFGSDPAVMAEAAKIVEQMGFDTIDLNLGCPAKKVVKCNGGSGLLRDLPLLGRLFGAIRDAVGLPFTVKFRAGWDEAHLVHVELARRAEDAGVNGLALHARTREQGYAGQAQWGWIAEVKQAVAIPVLGNGDVRSPEDAAAMIAATGCDGVMIGRTAASNPWIFRQMEAYRTTGGYTRPTEADRAGLITDYFGRLVREDMPGGLGKMKQFAAWFTHGVEGGGSLRKAVYEARSEAEAVARVEVFFRIGALTG
ncbi:MAG: tRNA dihydrouridine synthase DusB [Terriglobales bacterium]